MLNKEQLSALSKQLKEKKSTLKGYEAKAAAQKQELLDRYEEVMKKLDSWEAEANEEGDGKDELNGTNKSWFGIRETGWFKINNIEFYSIDEIRKKVVKMDERIYKVGDIWKGLYYN